MHFTQLLKFLVTLSLFNAVLCIKFCTFSDIKCMTRGADRKYKDLVAGIDGEVDCSDPLYYGEINGEIESLKYKIANATLQGLADCKVTKLLCDNSTKLFTFEYFLRCPKLVITAFYEGNGLFAGLHLDDTGATIITADDYLIMYKGNYGRFIHDVDNKERYFIEHFEIDSEPKGKVTFAPASFGKEESKIDSAKDYANKNWREVEKAIRKPVIHTLLKKALENYSGVLRTYDVEDVLPREESESAEFSA